MSNRQVLLYFAWSRPAETGAPLSVIDDRFPAIFELRRLFYPKFEPLADPVTVDQGIAGFLDHVQRPNFRAFIEQTGAQSGRPVTETERADAAGAVTTLDEVLTGVDTLVVISFDSLRTAQRASPEEVAAVARFLADPDHLAFICPHHDIGEAVAVAAQDRPASQLAEHLHHGDHAIPPRQGFGGFARSLLAGLGVPINNVFGLRPALAPDGAPAPVEVEHDLDELGLLHEVTTFNAHAHLPQLERLGAARERMDVLARQRIEPGAPPHPFTRDGRSSFDALLQSKPQAFAGKLLVCDTTIFSSTAGGVENLRRFWSNIVQRPRRT